MSKSEVIILSLIVLPLLLFLATFLLFHTRNKLKEAKKKLERYSKIMDVEGEALALKGKATKLKENYEELSRRYEELKLLVADLSSEEEMSQFGLYRHKYDLGTSEEYKEKVNEIRDKQKEMIKDKKAAYCTTEWTIGGSKAEGRKSTNRIHKLALNSYNVECDNLIMKVKYNNVEAIHERMDKLHERIEKLLEPQHSHISNDFHKLKIQELEIVHEYQEKLQQEKEEQREIREQMREEEKARKEYEAAQSKAEKEEKMYEKALEKAKAELEKTKDDEKEKMLAQLKELEEKLELAHQSKERAMSMAQQTRQGHVYVISNIGSFGDDVFKIGLTRRLEPLDRVKELGDASVPFAFDVHAMIFSKDAPSLEKTLHEKFDLKRVNRVNNRKEFFNVPLAEIKSECDSLGVEVKFTKLAEAQEYRETLQILKNENESEPVRSKTDISDLDLDINIEV